MRKKCSYLHVALSLMILTMLPILPVSANGDHGVVRTIDVVGEESRGNSCSPLGGNTQDCPGGWCETKGVCEACCAEGESPVCTKTQCQCKVDNSIIGSLKGLLRKLKSLITGGD